MRAGVGINERPKSRQLNGFTGVEVRLMANGEQNIVEWEGRLG